ncbi:hypothetical protein Scep_026527 [Stephania cephalantha]|uniref:Uncharacterized protein n=1 Tax=Stephania cephalantha TaxID=152367 RepID=A0AAP0EQY0_9MAGN
MKASLRTYEALSKLGHMKHLVIQLGHMKHTDQLFFFIADKAEDILQPKVAIEAGIMVKYTVEGCKNNIRTAMIQNYPLVDMRVEGLEQNINSQGSELEREVAQVKLQVTQGNGSLAKRIAPGGALATLGDMRGGSAEHNS